MADKIDAIAGGDISPLAGKVLHVTPEMIEAGKSALWGAMGYQLDGDPSDGVVAVFSAMLSAAWRPIGTAPKDETLFAPVLLYGPDMGVGIGWFDDADIAGVVRPHWVNSCWPDHDSECEPTHWMPLPEPHNS